jgi:pimeloyl-ACP methyl ester carboxylesterase
MLTGRIVEQNREYYKENLTNLGMKMMENKDCFANSQNTNIHYLDSASDGNKETTPLVYVPGVFGFAEQFRDEMLLISNRRCVSISLRGRGKSDAPSNGYSIEEQVSDIEAVVKQSGVQYFCLMAYSMGVPFALKYAIENSSYIKGLILCDYPASYPKLTNTWSTNVISKGLIRKKKST